MQTENFSKLEEVVKSHVLAALKLAGGNKAKAAGLLGVSIKTVYNHVNRYGDLSVSTPVVEAEVAAPTAEAGTDALASGTQNNIFG